MKLKPFDRFTNVILILGIIALCGLCCGIAWGILDPRVFSWFANALTSGVLAAIITTAAALLDRFCVRADPVCPQAEQNCGIRAQSAGDPGPQGRKRRGVPFPSRVGGNRSAQRPVEHPGPGLPLRAPRRNGRQRAHQRQPRAGREYSRSYGRRAGHCKNERRGDVRRQRSRGTVRWNGRTRP